MKAVLLCFSLVFLTGCIRVTSPRDRALEEADDMERKGFDDTAHARREEARSLSDDPNLEVEWQITGPDEGSVRGRYYGNEEIGYVGFPRMPVSVERAIMIAKPFLKESAKLRRNLRPQTSSEKPRVIHVTLAGSSYFVIRDNYPTTLSPILKAIRVDATSGEVTLPKA